MKSKRLLLLLLMALVVPWAANAQTRDVATVDFETGNISALNAIGFVTNDATYPWVITNAANHTEGGTYCIKSSNEDQDYMTSSFEMEVAFNEAGSISFYAKISSESGWDKGYFSIDGTNKISGISGNGSWISYSYEVAAGIHTFRWYYTKDSSGANNDDCFYVDDITFSGYYVLCCPKPTNLACTALTGTPATATFSWTNGGDETQWQLEYSTAQDFTGATPVTINQTDLVNGEYTLTTGLTAEQNYYARIRAICPTCNPNYSEWSNTIDFKPTNAVSECEDFEGVTGTSYYTEGSMPDGWYSYTTATGYSIVKPHVCSGSSYNYYHSSSQSLVFESGTNANGNAAYAVMPANTTGDDYASLTFYTRVENTSYGTLQVGYVTAQTEAACNNFTPLASGTITSSSTLHKETIDVSSVPSNAFIAFKWQATSGTYYACGIDDVCISTLANPFPKPKNLIVSNVTNEGATASWEAPTSVTPTGYKYQYKPDGGTWSDLTPTTALSAPLTDLTANTNYTFQVQAIYAEGESAFASTTFTTEACALEDKCELTYTLEVPSDYINYGWYYSGIYVLDANTDEEIAFLTIPYGAGVTSLQGTLPPICNGTELIFTWYTSYSIDNDNLLCSYYEIIDANGEVVLSGSGVMDDDVYYTMDCTISPCKRPTDFTATEPGPNSVKLNWTENGEATSWIVAYKAQGENGFTEREVTNNVNLIFDGLTPETPYEVKVRPVCEVEKWSEVISFETTEACPAPYDITVYPLHESANISWTGYNDTYTVKYRLGSSVGEPLLEEHFNGSDLPTGWAYNGEGTSNWSVSATSNAGGTANELMVNWTPSFSGVTRLVTPALDLTGVNSVLFSCNLQIDWYEEDGEFGIATSSDNGTTWHIGNSFIHSDDNNTTTMPISVTIVTEDMDQANVKFCFYYSGSSFNFDALYIDDIIIGTVAENEWQTAPNGTNLTATSFNLTGLTMDTPYEVKVEGHCGATVVESEAANFTTCDDNTKIFTTAGNWDVADNWEGGIPAASNNAIIRANATIPAEYDAVANLVTIEGNPAPTITIKDGGQLHANSQVMATVEKDIIGYTGDKDHYYLISAPFRASTTTSSVVGLLDGTFDFYAFNGTQDLEWRNHQVTAINSMANGKGYLYAKAATATAPTTTLKFTGTVAAQLSNLAYINGGSALTYNTTAPLGTFNLVGNSLPHNGYVYIGTVSGGYVTFANTSYYKMNTAGDEIEPSDEEVKPCEGIFVQSSASSQYAFVSSESHSRSTGLNLALTQGNSLVDRALIRFGEGNNLDKFQLNPSHTKIYMPVEGKDCAAVYTEESGEMPVCFKASENGTYTLSFAEKNVEFSYLHLIDNMTGADVDLLATPSYSFEARTTDYASRFKLVFATGDNADGNFAFFSNGSFIINNEGNATLQVIDVTGRVIKSESINGCANVSVNAATGVYMLRLINGNDVKVQKVVVR